MDLKLRCGLEVCEKKRAKLVVDFRESGHIAVWFLTSRLEYLIYYYYIYIFTIIFICYL